jgi:DNA repair exonuclease SbcCD ATPase subunit
VSLFHDAGFDIQQIAVTGPMRRRDIKSISGGIAYIVNMSLAGALTDFLAHQRLVLAVASSRPD